VTRVVEEEIAESETAADMAAAEAPPPMPTLAATPVAGGEGTALADAEPRVQFAGAKTFLNRDGVWVDTAYDADRHTPQPIPFAGDAYFDLLATAPELGEALALGERVLVVYEDTAYQIVGEGETAVSPPDIPNEEATAPSDEEEVVEVVVTPPPPDNDPTAAPEPAAQTAEQTSERPFSPRIGLGVALLLLVVAVLAWRVAARGGR
jgi:hypothetical protein